MGIAALRQDLGCNNAGTAPPLRRKGDCRGAGAAARLTRAVTSSSLLRASAQAGGSCRKQVRELAATSRNTAGCPLAGRAMIPRLSSTSQQSPPPPRWFCYAGSDIGRLALGIRSPPIGSLHGYTSSPKMQPKGVDHRVHRVPTNELGALRHLRSAVQLRHKRGGG